jgi:hypothetical protein
VWHELQFRNLKAQNLPLEAIETQKKIRDSIRTQLKFRLDILRSRLLENLVEQQLQERESAYCEGCVYSLKKNKDGTNVQVGDADYDPNFCEVGMRGKDQSPPRVCPFFTEGDWVNVTTKFKLDLEKVDRLEQQYLSLNLDSLLEVLVESK